MALCTNCGRSRCCAHIDGQKDENGREYCSICQIEKLLEATTTPPVSPSNSSALLFGAAGEWLFDGHAVLSELRDHERLFVSPEAVSAVLDAVVRLTKKAR